MSMLASAQSINQPGDPATPDAGGAGTVTNDALPPPLTLKTFLAYGVGMTGNQILRDVPTAMLLFYMTNTLLLPPALAGFAILLPKVWVVFCDPLVGSLSDRTQTRWGARKPFMFAGSIIATLTFIALFSLPFPHGPVAGAVVVGLLYAVLATGYSLFSVPYLALAAELGSRSSERTTALAFKQIFCLVGVVAGLALAPWLVQAFGGGHTGYRYMAECIGFVLFASTMASALMVPTPRARVSRAPEPIRLMRDIGSAFAHRPFRTVFIASTLQLLGFGILQAGSLYYLIYILNMTMSVLSISIVASVAGSALGQIMWTKLANRLGITKVYRFALVWSVCATLGLLLIPAHSPIAYGLLGLFAGAGTGGVTFMSFSALVEAIALDGPDSNRKALFAAAYSAMEKAMMALGGFVLAQVLSMAHFAAGAAQDAQPAGVGPALILTIVGIPAVLHLASILVLRADPRAA